MYLLYYVGVALSKMRFIKLNLDYNDNFQWNKMYNRLCLIIMYFGWNNLYIYKANKFIMAKKEKREKKWQTKGMTKGLNPFLRHSISPEKGLFRIFFVLLATFSRIVCEY